MPGEYRSLSELGMADSSPFERSLERTNEQVRQLTQNVGQLRPQVQQMTQGMSAMIQSLEAGMESLRQEVANLGSSLQRVSSGGGSSARRQTQATAEQIENLAKIYRDLGVTLTDVKLDYDELITKDKQIIKVNELYEESLKSQIGSYDQISAKYRILKILYDNMSDDMLAKNPKIAADLRGWYEQMNLLQQATGKYQLQVGDYSKAMTGLNIATVQIVREMPTLANSLSQFVIAISNNVPIWLSAIEKVAEGNKALREQAEVMRAEGAAVEDVNKVLAKQQNVWKAIIRTLTGYQTWIIIILTVLPKLIKSIRDKRKAQQEDNKETEKAITLMGLLDGSIDKIQKSMISSASDLASLGMVMDDTTRSIEDQTSAWEAIKRLYPDIEEGIKKQKKGYEDATTAVQTYIEWLEREAEAKAILSEISEAIANRRAAENRLEAAQIAYEEELATQQYEYNTKMAEAWRMYDNKAYERANELFSEAAKIKLRLKTYTDETKQILDAGDESIKDSDLTTGALVKRLQTQIHSYTGQIEHLRAELTKPLMDTLGAKNNEKGAKEHTEKIKDYYIEMMEAVLANMEEGTQKEIATAELGWIKQEEDLKRAMLEMARITREGNAEEREEAQRQLSLLRIIYQQGYEAIKAQRENIIKEMLDFYKEEVEEEDVSLKKSIETRLKLEKESRDNAAYLQYENSKRTAEDKEALDNALRDSERTYWENYLKDLRDNGELTVQLYNEIMAKLVQTTKKYTEKSDSSRGKRGRRYGGIAEAFMAQTETFGAKNKYGMQVVKDEYADFAKSIDAALKSSMKSMEEWMDKRIEMAQIAVEAAQKEVDSAKTALEYEMEARANGYANQVETAQRELQLARQKHKEALEEEKKWQQAQLAIDTITQISSLVTATANIWASMTKGTGVAGPALALAATGLLWGSFAAAKIRAAQLTKMKAEQYGEGHVELLQGGSHASGHDIDLGTRADGTRRRAEGGEYFAVINKRSSRKYGSRIPQIITALNHGTFDDKYMKANTALADYALNMYGESTDVSSLEHDVHAILGAGAERRYTDGKGRTIVTYKNLKRVIN